MVLAHEPEGYGVVLLECAPMEGRACVCLDPPPFPCPGTRGFSVEVEGQPKPFRKSRAEAPGQGESPDETERTRHLRPQMSPEMASHYASCLEVVRAPNRIQEPGTTDPAGERKPGAAGAHVLPFSRDAARATTKQLRGGTCGALEPGYPLVPKG